MANIRFEVNLNRKTKTITIDPRVWNVIESKANRQGIAASRWLENFLFDSFQNLGDIDVNEKRLGELRGGDRKSGNT